MMKTENYNLNQWEPTDHIRREDFNADNTAIDAALGALSTAAAGFGNCHIAAGSYNGTGTYGSSSPTTLEVGFAPRLVFIYFEHFEDQYCRMFLWPGVEYDFYSTFSSAEVTQLWGETSFGQYCTTNDFGQMNYSGYTYSYIVIG